MRHTVRAFVVATCILGLPGWCEVVCAAQLATPTTPTHCNGHDAGITSGSTWSPIGPMPTHCGDSTAGEPRVTIALKKISPAVLVQVVAISNVCVAIADVSHRTARRQHTPPGTFFALRI